MRPKTNPLLVFATLLLTMCRSYQEWKPAEPVDGLSCRSYTEYFAEGVTTARGLECYYTCPDKTAGPFDFEFDPSLAATRGDLDRQFCGIVSQSTATQPPATASLTPPVSPTVQASLTSEISPTAPPPLLTGLVSMCDLGSNLINFRLNEPAPDLTATTLEVQIQEQASTCYANPVNPALLTCSIPTNISFPASVAVRLDGVLVNEFVYSGAGCTSFTTATPRVNSYP